jgi:CDP-diacylglycerol--glycerol-3-phosphate 3-phosphatidyltransferase
VTTVPTPAASTSTVAPPPGFGPGALLTPANLLTLARIAATPAFLYLLVLAPVGWPTWLAWALLCTTDLVDGRLARKHGTTRSGAFLDPLADKVLVLGAFATLVAIGRMWWLPAGVVAVREVAMSAYRSQLARRGVSVPANRLAKAKTWSQCVAAGLLMWPPTADLRVACAAVLCA